MAQRIDDKRLTPVDIGLISGEIHASGNKARTPVQKYGSFSRPHPGGQKTAGGAQQVLKHPSHAEPG